MQPVERADEVLRPGGLAYGQPFSFRAPDVLRMVAAEACVHLCGVAGQGEHMTKCRGLGS